jgi:hypothetical protein
MFNQTIDGRRDVSPRHLERLFAHAAMCGNLARRGGSVWRSFGCTAHRNNIQPKATQLRSSAFGIKQAALA